MRKEAKLVKIGRSSWSGYDFFPILMVKKKGNVGHAMSGDSRKYGDRMQYIQIELDRILAILQKEGRLLLLCENTVQHHANFGKIKTNHVINALIKVENNLDLLISEVKMKQLSVGLSKKESECLNVLQVICWCAAEVIRLLYDAIGEVGDQLPIMLTRFREARTIYQEVDRLMTQIKSREIAGG